MLNEVTLLKIDDKDDYYIITCDEYEYDLDSPYIKRPEDVNLIKMGFDYSLKEVGWGCGSTGTLYAEDIVNALKELRLLKSRATNELSYTFKDDNFNTGYYFKITMKRVGDSYDAELMINDDLDEVYLHKIFSEEWLDEHITYFENCVREYPVRYTPSNNKLIEE